MDASLLKRTRINERMSCQFGFEAFNLMNHNYFGRDDYNTDPNSANFGSVFPSQVSTQNILPRQIQVRFKFNWQRRKDPLTQRRPGNEPPSPRLAPYLTTF